MNLTVKSDLSGMALMSVLRRDIGDGWGSPARLMTVRVTAIVLFRLSHACGSRIPLAGYALKQINHVLTGADIAWQARIGPGLKLYHPTGVVIGPYVEMGPDCAIQQGVTVGGLGGESATPEDSPELGAGVALGAGCRVIGRVRVGDGSRIGANAVVTKDVPAGATAVGVPARVLSAEGLPG